jgi:hypothetical protein
MVQAEKPPHLRTLSLTRRNAWAVCLFACVAISCVIFSGETPVSFTFKDSHEMDKDMELLSTTHESIGAKLKQDGTSLVESSVMSVKFGMVS